MKFRKKPVVIDAIKYNGSNHFQVAHFMNLADVNDINWNTTTGTIIIHTLEGDHAASINDWIIKGVKGEFYPCKPDIFAMTYEEANENQELPNDEEVVNWYKNLNNFQYATIQTFYSIIANDTPNFFPKEIDPHIYRYTVKNTLVSLFYLIFLKPKALEAFNTL